MGHLWCFECSTQEPVVRLLPSSNWIWSQSQRIKIERCCSVFTDSSFERPSFTFSFVGCCVWNLSCCSLLGSLWKRRPWFGDLSVAGPARRRWDASVMRALSWNSFRRWRLALNLAIVNFPNQSSSTVSIYHAPRRKTSDHQRPCGWTSNQSCSRKVFSPLPLAL